MTHSNDNAPASRGPICCVSGCSRDDIVSVYGDLAVCSQCWATICSRRDLGEPLQKILDELRAGGPTPAPPLDLAGAIERGSDAAAALRAMADEIERIRGAWVSYRCGGGSPPTPAEAVALRFMVTSAITARDLMATLRLLQHAAGRHPVNVDRFIQAHG